MIKLKSATMDDAQFLFDLRNEESNRMMFKDTSLVRWEDHLNWLSSKLSQKDFFLFIAIDESENKVGQFRIDSKGEVSVSLVEKFKGQGFGWKIIKLGSDQCKMLFAKPLVAEVKSENASSLKAFQKAGYEFKEKYTDESLEYWRLVFN